MAYTTTAVKDDSAVCQAAPTIMDLAQSVTLQLVKMNEMLETIIAKVCSMPFSHNEGTTPETLHDILVDAKDRAAIINDKLNLLACRIGSSHG